VIQAILRQSDVAVTRESYIKRSAVDTQSLAAMKTLEALVCNWRGIGRSSSKLKTKQVASLRRDV
jgi:hypothetical protein